MNTLAVIPARGGSKGLPGKNILTLAGKPLIAYTIEAAQAARSVDRIVVSTDDAEIAEIARTYGAEVPFIRPDHLSNDTAIATEVCLHALEFLKQEEDYEPELAMFLQPTSPLRSSEDIDGAVELLRETGASAVVSLKEVVEHPQWMRRLDAEQRVSPLFPELEVPHVRQGLEKAYILNGAVYVAVAGVLLENRSFHGLDTRGYVMPRERSIDIDTAIDFAIVDHLIT